MYYFAILVFQQSLREFCFLDWWNDSPADNIVEFSA